MNDIGKEEVEYEKVFSGKRIARAIKVLVSDKRLSLECV